MDDPAPRPLPAPPVLDCGGGVVLRRHRADDIDAMVEQCQDPEMQRFTTVPVPYERHHAEEFLAHIISG